LSGKFGNQSLEREQKNRRCYLNFAHRLLGENSTEFFLRVSPLKKSLQVNHEAHTAPTADNISPLPVFIPYIIFLILFFFSTCNFFVIKFIVQLLSIAWISIIGKAEIYHLLSTKKSTDQLKLAPFS